MSGDPTPSSRLRTLTLRLEDAKPNAYLLTSQARVHFRLDVSGASDMDSKERIDHEAGGVVCSTLDNDALMSFVNQLQDIEVDGHAIVDALVESEVSMWQFIASHIQAPVMRVLELINIVRPLVVDTRPDAIAIVATNDVASHLWERTVTEVAAGLGVPVCVLSRTRRRPRTVFEDYRKRRTLRVRARQRVATLVAAVIAQLLARSPPKLDRGRPVGKKLLFATSTRHWVRAPGERGFYDEQLFPLLPALRAAGWSQVTGIDCACPTTWRTICALFQRRQVSTETDVVWRTVLPDALERRPDARESRRRREVVWERIRLSPTFQEHLTFKGVPLWRILRDDLNEAMTEFPTIVRRTILGAQRVIVGERPDALMVTSEAVGLWERALVVQAQRHGVPTVGLQHGMIFANHYHYMHRSIITDPTSGRQGFQRPQVTCVWGPGWKEVLTRRGHYPAQAVKVTGNWRYDPFARLPLKWSSHLREAHGIGRDVEIALVVSGGQNVSHFISTSLRHLATRTNCLALVKPHACDDLAAIVRLLKRTSSHSRARLCTQLLEGLLMADIVISQISTVVAEAAYLRKPIIMADFEHVAGWDAYTRSGICIRVTRESELSAAVNTILPGGAAGEAMQVAQVGFSEQYLGRSDGQSASRVVNALEEVCSVL